MVETVNLLFSRITWLFIRDIHTKFGVPKSLHSPDIWYQTGIFPIPKILVKSIINKSCHNYRANNDTNVKLGPLTKLDKKNTTMSKKTERWSHVSKSWHHFHFSNLWPVWSNLEVNAWSLILKFSLTTTFHLKKTEAWKKCQHSCHTFYLSKRTKFSKKSYLLQNIWWLQQN